MFRVLGVYNFGWITNKQAKTNSGTENKDSKLNIDIHSKPVIRQIHLHILKQNGKDISDLETCMEYFATNLS